MWRACLEILQERGQNSPFLICQSVFHQESFKTDPTIGSETSRDQKKKKNYYFTYLERYRSVVFLALNPIVQTMPCMHLLHVL